MELTRKHVLLLIFLLATQAAAALQKNVASTDPDAEVKEFQVSGLEVNLKNMQPGPERDFFDQINAILGYPVFQALGTITFLHSGGFEAGDAIQRTASGVRMYMRRLTPVIECGVEGHELPFTFDTGASETDLSIRYYEQFRGKAGSWKQRQSESSGAGGTLKRTVYVQPRLVLTVGDKTANLENVSIFPARMNSGIDELYGNLGQDLVAGFESFTLDFSRMTFSLGPPLADRKRR